MTIRDDLQAHYKEWDLLMYIVGQSEVKLYNLKKEYDKKEQKILIETDFKALYGANNDKVRRNHVKTELADEDEEIKFLEIAIANAKRKISYLKSLIRTNTELLGSEMEAIK